MHISPENPRSNSAAIGLLLGWFYLLGGAFILVVGGRAGLSTALAALGIGAAFVVPIYLRERRRKPE